MDTILLVALCLMILKIIICQITEEVFSENEIQALKKLRPLVKDSFYLDYHNDDKFLINWLRNKDLDVQQTKTDLEKNFKYRLDNKLDTVTDEPEMQALMKSFPNTYGEAIDNKGSPAWLFIMSTWDIRKAVLAGKGELLNRYVFFIQESISKLMRKFGTTQWIVLADFNNYTLRKQGCLACIPFILQFPKVYENYFLNSRNVILFNAPRAFEAANALIFPLLSPATKKIYKVFGNDKEEWQKFILERFSAEQLTPQFGGNKTRNS